MLYTVDLAIPANTPKTSPVTQTVKLETGVLRKISVLIPPGHQCLAHVVLLDGSTQIFPRIGDLHGDGETVEADVFIEIPEPERILTLVGWNDDDTYQHTFYVRLNVLPLWLAAPHIYIMNMIKRILNILRIPFEEEE
jgi:hypothetical protein